MILIGNFFASCRGRYQLFSSKKPWASCWSRYHRVRWGRRRPTSSRGSGCSWSFPSFESGKFSSDWKLYWTYITRLLGWLINDYDRLFFLYPEELCIIVASLIWAQDMAALKHWVVRDRLHDQESFIFFMTTLQCYPFTKFSAN